MLRKVHRELQRKREKEKSDMKVEKAGTKNDFKRMLIARLINFTVQVLRFAKELRRDPSLCSTADQIIRSASSIGANIVEAQGANGKKDFANYFQIALKSLKETKYWLLVIRTYDKKFTASADSFLLELTEFEKIINSSLRTMRGR